MRIRHAGKSFVKRLKRRPSKQALKRLLLLTIDFIGGLSIALLALQLLLGSIFYAASGGLLFAVVYTNWLRDLRRRGSPLIAPLTVVALICLLGTTLFQVVAHRDPVHHARAFTPAVWLPDPKQNDPLDAITTAYANWDFRYGNSIVFTNTSTDGYPYTLKGLLYETRAVSWLQPKDCPNIAHIETETPGECKKIGEVRGSPVYAMNRSLPLGDYEIYLKLGHTFIFTNIPMGQEDYALKYLRTFVEVPAKQVAPQLRDSYKQSVATARHLQYLYKSAAQRLPFRPVQPTVVPAGWEDLQDTSVGGKDIDHPDLIATSYIDGKAHVVVVMGVAAKTFMLQPGSCGPVPHEKVALSCYPVSGHDYYYANKPGMQYLFRQIGDTMTITQVLLDDDDFKVPGKVESILEVGRTMSDSLQPVDASKFKHVDFVEGYGSD